MSELSPITVNVDEYLGLNKYEVDEGNPHIELLASVPTGEFGKLVRVCPAALYKVAAEGSEVFDYAGCLECGTCRLVCDHGNVDWNYPRGGFGILFKFG